MAQYYQIQNLEDLKQIYADVQVVHVASEDVGVGSHNRPQQLLLPDDQLMLNEGQQVVYQTTSVPAQQQYQQQPTATTTQYIIGDEISQQQQQQTVQHQQQVMYDHHHQQQQQHYVHESQQLQQDHHQLAQQTQQQQPQLYYTTEQILQPNSLVQQQQQQEMQHQQQQQQQLHVQQQQYQQQQQQQQQIVHQQHSMQTPQQTQQIVYRMQPQQQSQNQQTQMLNNAHVILQQPSGQQVLIQSPTHPEIIMRQSMPQQRIIYNTNRVLYTPQQQQQPQTQTILQQSPQAHQQHPQQQQHIQLQATPTTSPIHTTARLVQTRVGASPQETAQQHQQTPTQQNVVFHPIQATTVQNSQQLKPQIQQQSQMTIQQTPQQHLVASTMSGGVSGGGVMRGAIRNKSPRGGALGSTHTLIARVPVTTVGRAIRPPLVTPIQSTQTPRATRPRGGAAGGARARGAARGARGGAVIASRNTQVATPVVQPQQQSQQLQAQQQITPSQQIMQNAMNKNITILNQQGQVKHIYRNIGDSQQQQLQLVTGTSQAQQRSTQIVGARFRSPVVSTTSGNTNNGNNSSSSGNGSGNYELDLEDSIQAVVVKKDQQKPPGSTSNIANPVGTTLTSYFAKDDDDTRLVRTQNGACFTLAEYRKRHPPNPGSASTTTTTILQMKTPLRASGPPSSNKILSAHSSGNTGIVPVARVAPQPIQSTHQTQQSQTALTTTTSSSAVHRTSHNNYEIHTQHVMQNRNNTQMAEKDRNSAKMLVILVSGEQRLITFTLPRESCTVQDLLEQVGVPFDSSTTIQCVENPGANIDFVVTVGFSVQESASELISRAEQTLQMNRQQDPMGGNNLSTSNTSSGGSSTGNTNVPQGTVGQSAVTTNYGNLTSNPAQTTSAVVNESTHKDANSSNAAANTTKNSSNSSTNTTEDVPRKIIQGFLAVCQSCGFSGYDHAKCERCKRVFLEPPKRVPSVKNLGNNNAVDSTLSKSISNSEFMASDKRRGSDALARSQAKNALNSYGSTGSTTSARGRGGLSTTARGRGSRSGRRTAEVEPVILTLSSDEEDDDESSNKISGSFSTMSNAANSSAFKTPTYEPLSFEHSMPDLDENAIYADFQRDDVTDLSNCTDKLSTALQCKVVRIGTYRYEPKEPVTFTSKGVCLVAPLVNNPNDSFPLHIHKREVVKIIAHFSKVSESMLCFYTLRNCAQYIKNSLQMKDNGTTLDGSAYFSPNGPYQVRKIILQFSSCSDQSRNVIKSIWDFFDEISDVDAQDLLQRAEATDRQISNKTNEAASTTCVTTTQLNPNEIKQLLIYPPGKGGISINTEDYLCLATDQYLNDIIIDFYLKWVHNNVVPEAQRERAFIFSTFFYKRLTTLTRHHHNPDKDVKQTAAQKRHARVQNWTKNVNLFEKDFIIIPINEQSHWFLAIICFPTMKGPVTYDTNIPVEPQQLKKQKGKKVSLQIGNTTITPLSKRDSSTMLAEVCGVGDDDSERDEAEGDESDLASDDSDFDSGASTSAVSATISGGVAAANNNLSNSNTSISGVKSQAIKQPLILIFDSLAGASRSRVVATLRDYLTCEYRAKMADVTPHVFNKDNMPGHCVKVPQQNNFTDCGLYLLQYVEHFFKDPIRDYRLPIKQLSNWFDTLTVTRKREDISQLLQQLMNERNGPNHQVILPEIPLPTSNGQLVEPPEGYNIEFEEEETGEDAAEEDDDNTDVDGTPNDADGTASSTHTDELVSVKIPTTKTATTTTALVPTQGRKIVVKRRLQQVSSATVGNSNSENLNTTTSVVAGVAAQNIRSGNQAKYRKFE